MARKLSTSIFKVALLGGLAFAVSGCESTRETFGLNKTAPDEFQVVSRAPLSLPPDFTLRVPEPGAPRPQTGTTTDQARRILTGEDPDAVKRDITDGNRSQGQVALLSQSGAQYADPAIRTTVDRETSIFIEESDSVVDKLIFWQEKPQFGTQVDAEAEAKRIRDQQALGESVSEGETPVIERRQKGWLEDIF
ncbi:hypothetical protein ABIE64_002370 [Thalassospira sp. MBR-102]|jgi:hypothetical protein|uniref:DUF3035 domain-containing protein n=2 Tax=Thalassospira TaxID=168934 RepID=A0AB72UH46_9PROT|nr:MULTISPECIES: DUF3035 domain-containing protein [Thalassospira]MBR9780814.1 DUF3035 domain-containing protein [Rhodospirillales bacterium]AJD53480.1 hypothetical protein TH3_16890 [Thalassospira xiamenensis M-5 = DSM 17429]KEO59667.1 hypothetical protein SMB34_01395 [Thalassospira permensis NBRC 106175]MAB31554.1 DUF3035 domain-containing protein [Thalassospira sp.]MBA05513.1 DUF3035 domain-containing protein [Thalassospira sp.]|tara:strand:- start:264 stop:842 length:579 start_codon:yes stop_codon:yes gene_type:complete